MAVDVTSMPVRLSDTASERTVSLSQTGTENQMQISQTGTENTIQISQAAGENSVDLDTIGGNALDSTEASGQLPVDIKNTDPIPVTFSSGNTKAWDYNSVNVGANLDVQNIDFAALAGTTARVMRLQGFSQNQMLIELQDFNGTTGSTLFVTGTPAGGGPVDFVVPENDYISITSSGHNLRAVCTNLDKGKAADMHLTAFWEEAA